MCVCVWLWLYTRIAKAKLCPTPSDCPAQSDVRAARVRFISLFSPLYLVSAALLLL